MNKEQIETAAKEFLSKTSPDYSYQGKKWKDIKNYTFNEVVNFLQSMIDKSLIFDLDHVSDLRTEIISLTEENNSLKSSFTSCEINGHGFQPVVGFDNDISDYICTECGQLESTVSNAGKEVTERDAEGLALEAFCKHSEVDGFLFTPDQDCKSLDESNGYCIGFLNGYKLAILDNQFKSSPASTVPTDKEINEAAESWVFRPESKWSNNNDECGDNLGSFKEGAEWMRSKLTGE
jgi:hypothetical protein